MSLKASFQSSPTRWEKSKKEYRVFNRKVTRFNSTSWNELKDYLYNTQYLIWKKYSNDIQSDRFGSHKYTNNIIHTMIGLFIENMIKLGYSINRLSKTDLKTLDNWIKHEIEIMNANCLYLNFLYDIEYNIYQESIEFHLLIDNWFDLFTTQNKSISTKEAYEVNKHYFKNTQFGLYLKSKEFMDLFITFIQRLMKYSVARSIQTFDIYSEQHSTEMIEYLMECVQICFNLVNTENCKLWLEYIIQFRFTDIGDELHQKYKDKLVRTNIEFIPVERDKDFDKSKSEIDILTDDALYEIKFYKHLDRKDFETIVNKTNIYINPESNLSRLKICGIDAYECIIYSS